MNSQPGTVNPAACIQVHIERLVLDGPVGGAGDGELFRAALESELARQMASMSPNLASGTLAHARAPSVQLKSQNDPVELGQQIGQAVCGAVNQFNGHATGNQYCAAGSNAMRGLA